MEQINHLSHSEKNSTSPGTESVTSSEFRATVVVPIYNNQSYISAQLHSLFKQWRYDINLLVIDDGSTDRSFEIACKTINEYPEVSAIFVRNEKTLGMAGIPILLRHTSADIIIQADSDDISLPGRLDSILECFALDPACRLVTSNAVIISDEGIPVRLNDTFSQDHIIDNPLHWATEVTSPLWIGATSAFRRSILEDFPQIDTELCPYGFDLLMPFRAVLTGTHHYIARPLVGWRHHSRNSHKIAGAGDSSQKIGERYEALILMALAQKIRDAVFMKQSSLNPHFFEPSLSHCQWTFFYRFSEWSRLRNRLPIQGEDTKALNRPLNQVSVPPITTCIAGHRYHFGLGGELEPISLYWSGFYGAEKNGTWTGQFALLVFRSVPSVPDRLKISLNGLSSLKQQRVRFSINFAAWTETILKDNGPAEIILKIESMAVPDLIFLMIEAPDATIAPEPVSIQTPTRRLGLCLHWLEVGSFT